MAVELAAADSQQSVGVGAQRLCEMAILGTHTGQSTDADPEEGVAGHCDAREEVPE